MIARPIATTTPTPALIASCIAKESEGVDPGRLNDSQGYATSVVARAVIVIDCEDPTIRQVGCVFVGMAEVSSCVVEALPGQRVQKGDEIGYFQYGGSTYCLIFEPGVINSFVPKPPFHDDAPPLKINGHVATAKQLEIHLPFSLQGAHLAFTPLPF